MTERRVRVIWEIDVFPPDDQSEYQIAKSVFEGHFKGPAEADGACVFRVEELGQATMVDLSGKEETREQRLERLAKLLLSQIKDLEAGHNFFESDLVSDDNPVTRQLKALLS